MSKMKCALGIIVSTSKFYERIIISQLFDL